MDKHVLNGVKYPKKIILVGVGGASCSGKTTLAKHLRRTLNNSFIVHQDDFAPPEQLVPIHPIHNVQDWDDPDGAIEWPRLASFLRRVREEGGLPSDYKSHDGLNKQIQVPVSDDLTSSWAQKFNDIQEHARTTQGIDIVWGLVDGFLLYWHPDVVRELDVRLFLRVSYDTLKERRERRFGYHTAEGSLWQDPPGYWDDIVWPAYVKAHKNMFAEGDVSSGALVRAGEQADKNRPSKEPASKSLSQGLNGAGLLQDAHVPACAGSREPRPLQENLSFDDTPTCSSEARCGEPVSRLVVLAAETMDMGELFSVACAALMDAA